MSDYVVRPVLVSDASVVARHRIHMFLDMGELSESDAPDLEVASRNQLETLIASGEYAGWLAECDGVVVAGVGVLLHRLLPRAGDLGLRHEAYVLNVYTEPEHRRQGLSRRLMLALMAWCRDQHLTRITLHASTFGRPVYEALGFVPTNEMRLVLKH